METSAPVSIRGLYEYSNRIFGLKEKLRGFADSRRQPDLALSGVLWSWVLAFWRELPSTDWRRGRQSSLTTATATEGRLALGRRLREAPMRVRAGFAQGSTPSPDRLAEILEVVQDRDREEWLLEIFFQARQSKLLEGSLVAGLRLAAIDLNELFCSERVHCAQCQQRRKVVKRGQELEQVIEYYHQVVCLQWLGGSIPWPLSWELLGPGEGDWTARPSKSVATQLRRPKTSY